MFPYQQSAGEKALTAVNTQLSLRVRPLSKIGLVLGLSGLLLLSLRVLLQPSGLVQAQALIEPLTDSAPAASLRYVAAEGTDVGNDCAISMNPCATVQRAVDVAEPDDEIRVAAGTYTGVQLRQGITQVVYISQSVTIRGGYTVTNWTTSDPEVNATILDAQGLGRVIAILNAGVTLEGLRITGGDTQSFADLSSGIAGRIGGGLYIEASPQAVISGCQIYSNTATYFGGGLYAYSSVITVTQSRVFSNGLSPAYSVGGGIYAEPGISFVDNNIVFDNSAVYGGGVYLGFGSLGGRLSENQIYNNRAFQRGGGSLLISMQTPDVLISRNVFSQNVAGTDGGGMWLGTGISVVTGNLVISNTASNEGGGVYLLGSADTLVNNQFISNTADAGGGVSLLNGYAALIENYFEHNYAGAGGAVQAWDSGLTMTANALVSNTALVGGGLAFHAEQGQANLTGNVFTANNATGLETGSAIAIDAIRSGQLNNNAFLNNRGYALIMDDGPVTLTHNTIVSNVGGIRLFDTGAEPELTLINTIFARNGTALEATDGTTATLDGVLWFDNMANTYDSGYITIGQQITANPLLAADGYHLLTGSPAIDAGVPSGVIDDVDGEPRPSGSAADIGADEWQHLNVVDLSITQQAVPSMAYPAEGVTYTIAYRNAGGLATGVIISAEIPAGLTDFSVVSSGAVLTSVSQMPYTWQVADLPFDAGGLITITATVAPGLAPQVLTSTVGITASQSDSNPTNNTASAALTIGNRAPLANAGPDQTAWVSTLVTLDGSASSDPDGHLPLSYAWRQVNGALTDLSSNTISRPTFIAPLAPSILRFSLDVTDSMGLPSSETATVVVTVTDRPVTNLRAANDSPMPAGSATMFVAWAEGGTNIVYTWNFGDGATAVNQTVVHTYDLSGTYTAIVTATNGSGSVMATTPVTITNLPPVANAGPDRFAAINSVVMLDGSGSTDPDHHLPLSYEWWQISGSPVVLSSGTISRPVFTAPNAPGVLAFSLVVTDSKGLRSLMADTVVITASDRPITAMWVLNSSPTTLGQATWFTATTDGTSVVYTWDFGDGALAVGNPISHTYSARGFYTTIITAANGVNSLTARTPVTITNLAPVAAAGPDQVAIVSSTVRLDGSGSTDQDGHVPLAYQWTQTGGPTVLLNSAAVSQPIFTAPAFPSILTFTLRVTDAYGLASAADTTVVQVNDQAITGLQVHNNSPIRVGHSVNFTATLITGSNVLYQWNFGDGVIAGPTNLLTATHVYTRYGSFTAIVTATNQSGINMAETVAVVQPYSICIPLLRKDS